MTGGDNSVTKIPDEELLDDYYTSLHDAYNALHNTFEETGLTQDELAARLGIDKSLVSKRLNGSENLTLKTMSYMGSAMGRYLLVSYIPYDQVGITNYFTTTPLHTNTSTVVVNSTSAATNIATGITGALGAGVTVVTGATGTNRSINSVSVSVPTSSRPIGRVHG